MSTVIAGAARLALSPTRACAIGVAGEVSCWGDSFYGQAGAPAKGTNAPTSTFWTAVNTIALP
ncbi:MAG: hypothetical protein IT373_06520 [Polyangiaceae bacterium]|nr:hypothetical protein [Polyangiaceae bacterium]